MHVQYSLVVHQYISSSYASIEDLSTEQAQRIASSRYWGTWSLISSDEILSAKTCAKYPFPIFLSSTLFNISKAWFAFCSEVISE